MRSSQVWTEPPAEVRAPEPYRAVSPPINGRTVSIRYVDQVAIAVRGPATGREYRFSALNPIQEVAAADAEVLLRTRYFLRSA